MVRVDVYNAEDRAREEQKENVNFFFKELLFPAIPIGLLIIGIMAFISGFNQRNGTMSAIGIIMVFFGLIFLPRYFKKHKPLVKRIRAVFNVLFGIFFILGIIILKDNTAVDIVIFLIFALLLFFWAYRDWRKKK